jgi:glycosyltransferase involved in cell wall biosynthesis
MTRADRRADVLYVTYDGLLDPLGASQVLPYVQRLRGMGVALEILSFEKDHTRGGPREAGLAALLAQEEIPWTPRRYHKRPTLPATAWDVAVGRRHVARWARALAREGREGLVHARGYVSGLMGMAGTAAGAKLLFDMRGFWVDERIHGGYWTPGGVQARVGRWMERTLIRCADHLVVLTRRSTARLPRLAGRETVPSWTVIPTCVDLDRFRPAGDPMAARESLGLGPGPILIHVGTLTGWYDAEATMAVARSFVARTGGTFVVLSREVEAVRRHAAEAGVEALVRFVEPEEVPRWLQGADAGLALLRPAPSEEARYPTKIAEYLASGLAVLATPVGDVADLADGVALRLFAGAEDVAEAAAWLTAAVADPRRVAAARTRAEESLGVDEGARRLLGVYHGLGIRAGSRGPGSGGTP